MQRQVMTLRVMPDARTRKEPGNVSSSDSQLLRSPDRGCQSGLLVDVLTLTRFVGADLLDGLLD